MLRRRFHHARRFTLPFIHLLHILSAANARLSNPRILQDEAPGRLPNLYKTITLPTPPGGCSGTQQAFLDIYRSSNLTGGTTVLHLPGGAYMNLAGNTVESAGASYRDADYTLAVLYYRLPRNAAHQNWIVCSDPYDALEDVEAAMNELRSNYEEYHVDRDAIVTAGFSAGGHLAALYGTTCKDPLCPSAMVLHFPFLETGAKIFCTQIGSAFANNQDYSDCHPTALVDQGTPPTILYHASNDEIVPSSWMADFVQALDNNGIHYEYYQVEGGGHYLVPFEQVAAVSNGVLDEEDGYSSFVDRAVSLAPPSCIRCTDVATDWMVGLGQTCETGTWQIQNRCNEDASWIDNGYCQQSCFDAGRGYNGDICCPETPISNGCVCDDIPTPWMVSNNKTCEDIPNTIQSKCNADATWEAEKYCQKSCFDAGRGYSGDECCSNSCTECDDTPTDYMNSIGHTCETGTWHIQNNCNENVAWVGAGYCRQSCFEAERGYEGDSCCSR